ncbi:L-aminoadipate-semialdehyde dehydrogenase large subunit [Termitomyces sp. J132]|nr:L-aminoadipate-semialdehyde dehydrogenase large subunit [Termitomyces sp. J132]
MHALDGPPPVFPSTHDDFLFPDAIEFNMKNNADQPFFIFSDPNDGIQSITHLEFGRAAHRVAHLLRPPYTGQDGEVVAVMAHTDTILHQAIVAGLIIAGFVVALSYFSSEYARALESLIEATKTSLLVLCHQVQIEEIPSYSVVYPHLAHEVVEDPFEYYRAPKRPSISDTCIILHSSGSTGIPKAVSQTHLSWIQNVTSPELRDHIPRLRLGCMALPAFHMFGIGLQIFTPVYGIIATTVFPPTSGSKESPVVPSPESVLEHIKSTKTNAIFIVPSFAQVWATSQEAIDVLKELTFVGYAGGPLPSKVGNHLGAAGVRLNPIYGGTEFGVVSHLLPLKDCPMDWEYLRFYNHTKPRWIPQGDGTFELQLLVRLKLDLVKTTRLTDVQGFATADVFKRHPTKEGLWKIVGRLDDIITHSSGEKTIPGPMEVIITSNPLVQEAIIFGRERDQTGVLIELRSGRNLDIGDHTELTRLRNQIWPSIEEANSVAPAFSRIYKEMIMFSSKEKPLPRTGKGTVMRKAALASYASEIGALYKNIELNIAEYSRPPAWNLSDVEQWMMEQASELTSGQCTSPYIDIFDQGFDSLSSTILRVRIVHAMRSSDDPSLREASHNLDQDLIYHTRNIRQLSAHILSSPALNPATHILHKCDLIESLIAKYSTDLGPIVVKNAFPQSRPSTLVVLLTGSTGNLGSQILAELLNENSVDKVYAFNRLSPNDATMFDRHRKRFRDIGLDTGLLESDKLIFVEGDSALPGLGLDKGLYKQLSSSITTVIHSAWRLDFNLPLASFEESIRGSRHLVDLVRGGANAFHARFLFISSISSVQSWNNSRGPVPEEIIEDSSVALGTGYGESKYVVEILGKSGLQATSLRIGQICGGHPKGSWPPTEWFPMLVKSSVSLGTFPIIDGAASWLPVDTVAEIVHDIARSPSPPPVLNVVHPHPVEHKVIMKNVVSAIKDILGLQLQVVGLSRWLTTLELHTENATSDSLEKIVGFLWNVYSSYLLTFYGDFKPSAKLIGFLRQVAQGKGPTSFCLEHIQHISGISSQLKQSEGGDVKQWVKYWKGVGLFD